MPPDNGSIAPSSQSGKAINSIKIAAIIQLIKAFGPAICAAIKGVNSQPEPIIPPAPTINTLVVEISRFNKLLIPDNFLHPNFIWQKKRAILPVARQMTHPFNDYIFLELNKKVREYKAFSLTHCKMSPNFHAVF